MFWSLALLKCGANVKHNIMPRSQKLHPHSDEDAFNRILLLVAVIALNPGIGQRRGEEQPEIELLQAMATHAKEIGIDWQHCSVPTIRKDLALLKKFQILPDATHRAGYRLGRNVERR